MLTLALLLVLECRRCGGWLMQPMPGWSISDWIRSDIETQCECRVCVICQYTWLHAAACGSQSGWVWWILMHPLSWVAAGAILCTLCTAGSYSTGTGRWVLVAGCVFVLRARVFRSVCFVVWPVALMVITSSDRICPRRVRTWISISPSL